MSVATIRAMSEGLLGNLCLRLTVRSLSEISSAQERTPEAYLVKNMLDRYYRDDVRKREEYFSRESDWRT